MEPRDSSRTSAAKMALIYLALGLTWIVASDIAVALLAAESIAAIISQGIKGSLFVVVSALVVYFMVLHHLRRLELAEARAQLVYRRTISGATHLVNEQLNAMLSFKLMAEMAGTLDPDLGRKWERMLMATAERMRQLGELDTPSIDALERFLEQARMDQESEGTGPQRSSDG